MPGRLLSSRRLCQSKRSRGSFATVNFCFQFPLLVDDLSCRRRLFQQYQKRGQSTIYDQPTIFNTSRDISAIRSRSPTRSRSPENLLIRLWNFRFIEPFSESTVSAESTLDHPIYWKGLGRKLPFRLLFGTGSAVLNYQDQVSRQNRVNLLDYLH